MFWLFLVFRALFFPFLSVQPIVHVMVFLARLSALQAELPILQIGMLLGHANFIHHDFPTWPVAFMRSVVAQHGPHAHNTDLK